MNVPPNENQFYLGLYQRNKSYVFGMLNNAGDIFLEKEREQEASDIIQVAIARFLHNYDSSHSNANPDGFFKRICKNVFFEKLREKANDAKSDITPILEVLSDKDEEDWFGDFLSQTEQDEYEQKRKILLSNTLNACMEAGNEKHRNLATLYFVDDCSIEEAAEKCGYTRQTAWQTLTRFKESIRKCFQQKGVSL